MRVVGLIGEWLDAHECCRIVTRVSFWTSSLSSTNISSVEEEDMAEDAEKDATGDAKRSRCSALEAVFILPRTPAFQIFGRCRLPLRPSYKRFLFTTASKVDLILRIQML